MIKAFFDFTRLKQVVYVFVLELLVMSAVALVANSNAVFGKNLVQLIYDPIYLLFPAKVSFFLKPCLGLGCIFPGMTTWGFAYLFVLGVVLPLLLAYLICLATDFVAKRKQIV